jgi:hypothetical protein
MTDTASLDLAKAKAEQIAIGRDGKGFARASGRRAVAMSDSPSPFERAAGELRKLGITLRQLPGEYQVNLTGGPDENALTAGTLEEAVELGRDMAKTLAPALAAASRGRRPRRPLRMTPKAVRRRKIKAHNYRLRARALRKQREEG